MNAFLNIKFTSNFSDALDFSRSKQATQPDVDYRVIARELRDLRFVLENSGFSICHALEVGKDLAFELDRFSDKKHHGIYVLRKNAICSNLLITVRNFLEQHSDTQIVIANGCNPIGNDPEEAIADFWICLVADGGIFYAEDSESIKLFNQKRFIIM